MRPRLLELNLEIEPDRAYYHGKAAGKGRALYGVFVRTCNEGSKARMTASSFKVEDNQVIEGESQDGGPTTTKRLLELEEVVARNGQPVVLGGLVQEKETITKLQVPGLGSIPVLG